jgi:hypothetical protein
MAKNLLAERTYKLLREFFLELDNRDGNDFWERQIALGSHSEIYLDHHARNNTPETRLFVLMVDCIEDIRQAAAKTNGIKNVDKIMNKTCKDNAKTWGGSHPLIGGYTDDEGNSYVSNSYYALKTDKEVNLPPVPQYTKFPVGIIDAIKLAKQNNHKMIECPSLVDIKSYLRIKKAEQPKNTEVYYDWKVDGDTFSVDADYLERIIEFLGDSNISCIAKDDAHERRNSILYFTNNNGEEAILCPVRRF